METIMVTKNLSGGELFEKVSSEDFTLTEAEGSHFIRQICEGVAYIHSKNVVHLDLKPENIMQCDKALNEIKIVDFGLAKILKSGETDSDTYTNILSADYTFDEEEFDNITEDAKDFISTLLTKDQRLRPSCVDCLKHTWLKGDQDEARLKKLNTQNLRKFISRRRWQKCGQIRALKCTSSSIRFRRTSESSTDSGLCVSSPEARRLSDAAGYSSKTMASESLERKMGVSSAEFSYP